jgi:DMSO/TMAO reductase YedYZ molybdopterin-dependent catalytic subunit
MKHHKEIQEWSRKKIIRRSVFSFIIFILLILGAIIFWKWFTHLPPDKGANPILRKGLYADEKINKKFFSLQSLAPTYPNSESVAHPRVNGNIGEPSGIPDTSRWRLKVIDTFDKKAGKDSVIFISLQDIEKMPLTQYTTEFKCIEGWSQKIWWGGVKLSDFMKYYHLGTSDGSEPSANNDKTAKYVGFSSIDGQYYVGIDMLSALHPQTILCYEMNGKPLPLNQGAPLRLIIPIKYGVKNIKWIGSMYFSNSRPRDYWYERGYDYDAAL